MKYFIVLFICFCAYAFGLRAGADTAVDTEVVFTVPPAASAATPAATAAPATPAPQAPKMTRSEERAMWGIPTTPVAEPQRVEHYLAPAYSVSPRDIEWLARAIYSETKRAEEQELVAWTIRNRVETAYRGKRTYKGTVLDPYQFSAFNPDSPKRARLLAMSLDNFPKGKGEAAWAQALRIAERVLAAPASERPFAAKTRHFYSPVSMKDGATPDWAVGQRALGVAPDANRFRFFTGIH